MEWFKKHVDTAIVLGALLPALFWFHNKIDQRFTNLEKEIAIIKTEVVVIKAVLIMKDIMPKSLACEKKEKNNAVD